MNIILERLLSKLDRDSDSNGCWIWTGALDQGGYGSVKVPGYSGKAHRAIYQMMVGPVPDGLDLDHLCRNRKCCNPNHLEPVTRQENARRGECGLNMKVKTHCPKGHPYDEANTIRANRGVSRRCKTCHYEACYRRYHEVLKPLTLDELTAAMFGFHGLELPEPESSRLWSMIVAAKDGEKVKFTRPERRLVRKAVEVAHTEAIV